MIAMIDDDMGDDSGSDGDEEEGDEEHEATSRAPLKLTPASDFAAVARRLAAAKGALLEGYHRTRAQYVWRQHPHGIVRPDTTTSPTSGPDVDSNNNGLEMHDTEAAAVAEVAAETSHLRWRNLQARVARGSSAYCLRFSSPSLFCMVCRVQPRSVYLHRYPLHL